MKKVISTGFQSVDTFFLWTLQRFPYNNRQRKLVIRRTYQQRFFHKRFSKVDCELGSFQMISIFSAFWSLTKTSEGCLWMKLVDFLSKKTSFLALHLYGIRSSGVPVSEMVLVLVSSLMKAVFMESIPVEQTSGTFIDKLNVIVLKSSKLVSMKFFESKNFPRNFSPWNWFPGEFSKQTCCMIFRSTYFCSQGLAKN